MGEVPNDAGPAPWPAAQKRFSKFPPNGSPDGFGVKSLALSLRLSPPRSPAPACRAVTRALPLLCLSAACSVFCCFLVPVGKQAEFTSQGLQGSRTRLPLNTGLGRLLPALTCLLCVWRLVSASLPRGTAGPVSVLPSWFPVCPRLAPWPPFRSLGSAWARADLLPPLWGAGTHALGALLPLSHLLPSFPSPPSFFFFLV